MALVIRFPDGTFNFGPEGSEVNGFPVALVEASRYSCVEAAEQKLKDLLYPDGTGAEILNIH